MMRYQNMNKGSCRCLVALCAICLLFLYVPCVAEDNGWIHIPTTFKLREDQSDAVDDSIWLYYCFYAVNLYVEGYTGDELLDAMEQQRVYCQEIRSEPSQYILTFLDTLEMTLYLDEAGKIEQMSLVYVCPVHAVRYELFIDQSLSLQNLTEKQIMLSELVIDHTYFPQGDEDPKALLCCTSGEHAGVSGVEKDLMQCIQLACLHGFGLHHDMGADASGFMSYRDDTYDAYRWTILEKNRQRMMPTRLELDIERRTGTDKIRNMTMIADPPLLADLFELQEVYDEEYRSVKYGYGGAYSYGQFFYPGVNLLGPIMITWIAE